MMDYTINKILVPVDFTPASLNALDTAIAMANRHSAAILLLNVVEPVGLSGPDLDPMLATETDLVHNSEHELQLLQNSIKERFLISCEVITTSGNVSSSISKVCTNQHADMIVMGTHGASGFKEFCIGSNAFNVVKNSTCPVLTIPPQKKYEFFKKILFPVRPIPAALEKYDFARKIIRKNDAVLKILGLTTDHEKDIDLIKKLTSQLKEKLADDSVESSMYFKVGKNMAEEVLKIASLIETDLIVITATIETIVKQFFIGPYTRHIINHSRFPVLSIRPVAVNNQLEEMAQNNQETFSGEMPLYN